MTLLHAIEACLRAHRLPPSRFGRDAVRDPRLVHDLRRGRQPGHRVEQRVRAHLESLRAPAADGGANPAPAAAGGANPAPAAAGGAREPR